MRWSFVLAVVTGCTTPVPKTDGPPCRTAGAQFFHLADDALGDAGVPALAPEIAREREILVATCERDAWSGEVRACMGAAADRAAFAACEDRLPEPLRHALERARRAR